MAHLLFLSHAGIDSEAAKALAVRLEAAGGAEGETLDIWIDKRDLAAGGRWKDALQEALHQSTAFAVYVGTRGVINWVWDEVSVALDRAHADPQYPIVPILAAGAKPEDLPSFLAQYQGVVDVERDGEAFNRLVRAVLRRAPRAAVAPEREPFVGLRAFDSSKTHLFFGRDKETNALVTLVRDNHLVMVTGDSGSGKSSLIKAGLVPAFRGGRFARPASEGPDDSIWQVIETRPGSDPFGRLADDLREAAVAGGVSVDEASRLATMVRGHDPATVRDAVLSALPGDLLSRRHVLLVIDQFEEFRTSPHAAAYVACLLSLADPGDSRVRVVTAMRRDFYYACAGFPALYERLECDGRRARFLLGRMSAEGLEASVVEPLRLAGITDRERRNLAAAVLEDVGDQPGELALLEMALTRTWAKRSEHGGDLLAAYRAIGRVDGALAQAADEVFRGLDADDRRRCEVLFVRLVRPAEAGGATRVIAPLREFDEPTQALARDLAKQESSRLLTLGEATVEISHEQLATQWLQYQRWISNAPGDPASGILRDPRGDDLRLLRRLAEDARRWKAAPDQEKTTCLAKGYDLGAYLDLRARRDSWLWGTERDFAAASKAEFDREETAKARTRRNLQRTTVASVVFMLIAVLVAAFAALQWRDSLARQLAAQAVASQDPRLALLLAVESVNVTSTAETKSALLTVLERQHFVPRTLGRRGPAEIDSIAYTKDGTRLGALESVAATEDGAAGTASESTVTITVWDTATRRPSEPLDAPTETGTIAATEAGWLAVGLQDGKVSVWDSSTRNQHTAPGDLGQVVTAALSPEGTEVAIGGKDGRVSLWRLEAPVVDTLFTLGNEVRSLGISPDGGLVAAADTSGTIKVWDVRRGKQRGQSLVGHGEVRSIALGADGTLALLSYRADADGQITLWDVDKGTPLGGPIPGGDRNATSLAFAGDGSTLASGDQNGTISLWDMSVRSWQARACRMIDDGGRLFTDAQRLQYLGIARVFYGSACGRVGEAGGVKPAEGEAPGRLVQKGVPVKAGKFWMGCKEGDNECSSDEKPGRWVYLDGFFIDPCEVKVAQYRECVQAGKCTDPGTGGSCNWGQTGRDNHPINCVVWFQARAYCEWAGKRLPTEAEWEKAARGTDGLKYPWGSEEFNRDQPQANIGSGGTTPAEAFPPSKAYGLRDMAGNVWEWVWDKSGVGRELRGGSWVGNPKDARSSYRASLDPDSRYDFVGFRCVQ